jgi:hypothetical protein
MTAIRGHSFNVGPYGKNVLEFFPLKPVSQIKANMAWMVLKWSIFKIVSGDPDLHPRWPPSADIVLTYGPMGKNVLISSPLKPVSQYSKHVTDGP